MDERREKYNAQKRNAKQRGIEFDMTFEEWWEIWEAHYDKRGRRADDLQMCRTADEGAYRPGNVRIATAAENRAEAKRTGAVKAAKEAWSEYGDDRSDDLRGWIYARQRAGMGYFRAMELAEEEAEREQEGC